MMQQRIDEVDPSAIYERFSVSEGDAEEQSRPDERDIFAVQEPFRAHPSMSRLTMMASPDN